MAPTIKQIRVRDYKGSAGQPGYKPLAGELYKKYLAAYQIASAAAEYPDQKKKKDWFGANGDTKSKQIDELSKKIKQFINSRNTFSFRCSNVAGDMAFYSQKPKDKVFGGRPLNSLSKNPSICLGCGFHSSKYSWGEKVIAIIHEITHMAIGTSDEKMQNGQDAYGSMNCSKLKDEDPDKAYRNADNWAYYFGSYNDKITGPKRDWAFKK